MPRLPTIEPVIIKPLGIELHDITTVDEAAARAVRVGFNWMVSEVLERTRPGVVMCEVDHSLRHREQKAWAEAREKDESIKWEAFAAAYEPIRDTADPDPRLHSMTLAVLATGGKPLGGWSVYNIKTEKSTKTRITVSGMPLPGVRTRLDMTTLAIWSGIMRHILENDIEFKEDDRVLDLIQWDFPTRQGHAWKSVDQSEIVDDVIDDLSDHDIADSLEVWGATPISIRRHDDAGL